MSAAAGQFKSNLQQIWKAFIFRRLRVSDRVSCLDRPGRGLQEVDHYWLSVRAQGRPQSTPSVQPGPQTATQTRPPRPRRYAMQASPLPASAACWRRSHRRPAWQLVMLSLMFVVDKTGAAPPASLRSMRETNPPEMSHWLLPSRYPASPQTRQMQCRCRM